MFPINPLPSARARSEEAVFHEELRDKAYVKAPYLQHVEENHLKQLALQLLCKAGLTSGYDLGRLAGCRMRGNTQRGTGRGCIKGRHHASNSFYIEFKRSGDITYNCYGSDCRDEAPKRIGEWCDTVYQMLDSNQFAPGNNVDAALLKNLETLAIKDTPGKTIGARYANVRGMEFFPKLEEVVTTYLRGTVCRDREGLRAFHSMGSAHSPEAGCEDRLVPTVHERARHRQGLCIGNIVAQYLRQVGATRYQLQLCRGKVGNCSQVLPFRLTERCCLAPI